MCESIRPIAGAITLVALMGVRYLCPHNMIDLSGLVVNQDPKRGRCRYAINSYLAFTIA